MFHYYFIRKIEKRKLIYFLLNVIIKFYPLNNIVHLMFFLNKI